MRYADGQIVRIGDQVELWAGNDGVVVCSLDTDEYTESYPRRDWEYLGKGVLVLSEQGGLMHYPEPNEEMRLRKRQTKFSAAS